MRFTTIAALPLAWLLATHVCLAQPFEEVTDAQTYASLSQLKSAHLLEELSVPDAHLSRLEVAMLVQTALKSYASSALSGDKDVATETMLAQLAVDYHDELILLGTAPANTPSLNAETAGVEDRLAKIEETLAKQAVPADAAESIKGCADDVDTTPIASSLYGNFYLQTRYRHTDITTGDDENFSDVDIYWGELGVNASYDDWSGHFSVLLDDTTETVLLNEAWAKYQRTGECGTSPWFFQLGKVLVPFGNNPYYAATYPAVNDLSYSTLHALGGGYSTKSSGLSAYLYNTRAEVAGEDDTLKDYTAVWDIAKRDADECNDGYKLTVGYNSHLGSHDIRLAGSDVESRVPGVNFYGKYDWNDHGHLVHLLADYTYATKEFDPADLDANADGVGDKPSALNTELIIEPETDTIYGVSLQQTTELQDYAETRWGLIYGERLNKLAKFKLEYSHGDFGEFATGGQQSDDTLVGEINLAF